MYYVYTYTHTIQEQRQKGLLVGVLAKCFGGAVSVAPGYSILAPSYMHIFLMWHAGSHLGISNKRICFLL